MTGNVLIKNRTPSSDVPYLFGLPKQKTTLLRRTSVLRSKTLAEGEFTSPEHFNFLPESKKEVTTYVVTSFLERATRLARGTTVPRHAQRATNAPPGRFLASLAPCSTLGSLEPKNKGMTYVMPLFFGAGDEARTRFPASHEPPCGDSQEPCLTSDPMRLRRGWRQRVPSSQQKNRTSKSDVLFQFGAGDEARTRYLHLGKVALYQMSYARGTKRTIPDIFPFVKIKFQISVKFWERRLANAGKL